jgi:hypothetical protein
MDCRTVGCRFFGAKGPSIALSLFGECGAAALVCFGIAGATVRTLLGRTGGAVGGRLAKPQAADVSIKAPVTAQPAHRGKARTWNPLLIQALAKTIQRRHGLKTQHHETRKHPLRYREGCSYPLVGISFG